jgi:hypothetical protein
MDTYQIIIIVNIIILLLAVIPALIYLISIILVQRFHTTNNILTSNVCLATIICCLYWVSSNVAQGFFPSVMLQYAALYFFSSYFETMINCLLVYSLAVVTINRFVAINYPNKIFFRKRAWPFVSSVGHWVGAIILPIPLLVYCIKVNIS